MKKLVIGILAHVDSGKTTLSEALMYLSGNIKKLGRVDRRDAFLDTFSLERERGITIFSKQAVLRYKDAVFTLLDTPGHVDLSAETERTLQVLDYAILVIGGTDGVQSHTVTLWKLIQKYAVPCFIFINKTDLPGADPAAALAQLKAKLSDGCTDFTDRETASFFEEAALCDEGLLERYTETGTLAKEDLVGAIAQRKLFPCLSGSALRLDGVESFLDLLYEYTETPARGEVFAGRVFKLAEDKQGARLTFLKIAGGKLRAREVLRSAKNTENEKVDQIRVYSGEKYAVADEADAGSVVAVTGISFARPGDGLGAAEDAFAPILEPVMTYGVTLPEGTDAHTALERFRLLEREDPALHVEWDDRHAQIRVRLMGDIQMEILKAVALERFGLEVEFGKGKILYKETIAAPVEGVGHFEPLRHYAEVHLILKPGKPNSGLTFRTACPEDRLDKNWQRLILTHLYEKTHVGVLTGAPIADMEIVLVSGRAHPKHTEGGDFRQATYRAVRQGLRSAESILLEPVCEFTLLVPPENVGRAMTDIRRMSGEFSTPEQDGDLAAIEGTAPASELADYSREVIQYTRGKGSLRVEFHGYAPCHNADEVIAESGYDPDADTENPADSVFCSHGAGHTVKWDEVPRHMHLPPALPKQRPADPEPFSAPDAPRAPGGGQDVFALDKELMQIFEKAYGPVRDRSDPFDLRRPFGGGNAPRAPKDKTKPRYLGKEYLLVDGYNVIYSWDELRKLSESSMDAAREALLRLLCNYRGYRQCDVILVFDAYRVKGAEREIDTVGGVSVVYTKEAETADTYIELTSHELAKDHRVRVVTSDGMEQIIIFGAGALRVSAEAFHAEIAQVMREIRELTAQ